MLEEKKYVSVDIESSGPTPGKYSCLSIGACIVGDIDKQFYAELKPISDNYIYEAMKVGCLGLKCLENISDEIYNPKSNLFEPKKVLELLKEKGEDPKIAMRKFANWIKENTKGFKAVEVAAPVKFDGMFTAWYFDNFYENENPLGYNGENINSFYRGLKKDLNVSVKELDIKIENIVLHNALDDAIMQAKKFEYLLKMINN